MEFFGGAPDTDEEYEWLHERYLREEEPDYSSCLLGCGLLVLTLVALLVARA